MTMTAVSLFAGIGGFELAMERVGIAPVASVEIDKKASGVLTERFPNTQVFGDIKGVSSGDLLSAGFNPANGIITGGFPCQDLSVAGRRAGLAGERSGLFWEIHRLISETKTKWFVLENVPGLLSSNDGRDMGVVLGSLAELGYGLAYRVLDAQHFGVPQRRRRVFIVGSLGDNGGTPAEILAIAEGRSGYLEAGGKTRKGSATAFNGSPTTVGTLLARDHKGIDQISVEENKLVLFDLPNDDKEQKNDALLFQATRNENIRIFEKHSPTLAVAGWLRSLSVFSMHGAMIGRSDEAGPKGSGFLGDNEPSYTLTASSQARHGVVIAPTLSASNNPSRSPQSSEITAQVEAMVKETGVVRRLTPLECERLQGFPDGWTEGQADGHRYKQLGNAVAVPVVSWIIERLMKVVGEAQ